MKPSELRIGNFYLNERGFDCVFTYDLFLPMMKGEIKIEPILLTEEWLERFGLTKKYLENPFEDGGYDLDEKGNKWYHWIKGLFKLEIQPNGEIWIDVYSHYVNVKYVHQLQNLYYALSDGDELVLAVSPK